MQGIFENCAHFLQYLGRNALKGRRRLRIETEETMLKVNKMAPHDSVASIANNGAAARCALGLLVVVVLLLSTP